VVIESFYKNTPSKLLSLVKSNLFLQIFYLILLYNLFFYPPFLGMIGSTTIGFSGSGIIFSGFTWGFVLS